MGLGDCTLYISHDVPDRRRGANEERIPLSTYNGDV